MKTFLGKRKKDMRGEKIWIPEGKNPKRKSKVIGFWFRGKGVEGRENLMPS